MKGSEIIKSRLVLKFNPCFDLSCFRKGISSFHSTSSDFLAVFEVLISVLARKENEQPFGEDYLKIARENHAVLIIFRK